MNIADKGLEYADSRFMRMAEEYEHGLVESSFIAGYNEALNATRWRKVEEEMPPTNIDVIGKCKEGNFYICSYGKYSKIFILDSEDDVEIVEWKPIE